MKIGSAEIGTNVFLAPLAGCSDLSFRLMMRDHGAGFCFFEMVDANSVVRSRHRKSLSILSTVERDEPIAAQVLGEDSPVVLEAARRILERTKVSFLDINAACPVKKVIKKRAGAYLLKTPVALGSIIRRLSRELPVPVTVKIRSGFETTDLKALHDIARRCEDSGAAAIFVHGRTRAQGYSGKVDYSAIRSVKKAVTVPVFGSGDILSPELAKKMFDETGCDGILVARGSLGNPWIFRGIAEYLSSGKITAAPGLEARKTALKRHLEYIEKNKDLKSAGKASYSRKVVTWYIKGFENAASIRAKVSGIKTFEDMKTLVYSLHTA